MSYYAKLVVQLSTSDNQDFEDPEKHLITSSATYSEGMTAMPMNATNPGSTITISGISTPQGLLVENLGITAGTSVAVSWTNSLAHAQAAIIPIPAEGLNLFFTPDILTGSTITLTSSAGTIPCRISIIW